MSLSDNLGRLARERIPPMGVVKRGLWVQRLFHFFNCDGVAIFAVMRKVLICLNALRRKLADQHASAERTLPCKALVTPSAQRVAEWKKKTE